MATIIKTIPVQLDLNQRYVIRVRTINSFGVSSQWSEGLLIKVSDTVTTLDRPTGFTVTSGINSLILNWDLSSDGDISKYEIHAVPGNGNFIPSDSTLVGVVTQSNSFILSSVKVNGTWQSLSQGDVYTLRIRRINSAGDASEYTIAVEGTVGTIDDSLILKHTDLISAETGILSKIFILNATPTGAIPGDLWIQSDVTIPAVQTGVSPLAPSSFALVDETVTDTTTTAGSSTTIKLSWDGGWINDNSVEKIYIYRAVGSKATALAAINTNKPGSTALDEFLIGTINNPTNSYFYDDHSVDSTPVYYRIAGSTTTASSRPNGKLSSVQHIDPTANGKPRPISSMTVRTNVSSAIVGFTAPQYWYDPASPNYNYKLIRNSDNFIVNSSFYSSSATPYLSLGNLNEVSSYTIIINAVDKGGLSSTPHSVTFTTAPATPNQPLTLTASDITTQGALLTWTVSQQDSLLNDRYELASINIMDGGFIPTTINANITGGSQISYTVGSLTASSSYTFGVRAVDDGLVSNYTTTTFNTVADSIAPPSPVINWFKPYFAGATPTVAGYGVMYADVTWYPDALSNPTTYTLERKVDSGAWTTVYESATPQQRILVSPSASVGYVSGQTISIRVWSKDAANNSNFASAATSSYTLSPSPTLITATFESNYNAKWKWNSTNYDADYRYAPAQGYYSTQDSTYDMTGIWGYTGSVSGVSKFQEQLADKTIANATIYLKTFAPSYSGSRTVSLVLHKNTSKPGSTEAGPIRSSVDVHASAIPLNSAREIPMLTGWIDLLKSGEWKGVGVFLESGKTSNVATYYNISGTTSHVDSKSGRVTVYHLG